MKLYTIAAFFCCLKYLEAFKLSQVNTPSLPEMDACGKQLVAEETTNRAVADVQEYPWMVLVNFDFRYEQPGEKPRCAGALISSKHLITGFYCLQYFMENVTIGLYRKSQNVTCGTAGCQPVLEIKQEYWAADYEIALVKLKEEVQFTEYIQPICLPFQEFPKAEIGDTVYSSGWGSTYPGGLYSDIKKKIKQTIVDKGQCEKSGLWIPEGGKVLCTQVRHDEFTNIPCGGDDGAPVMYRTPNNQWVLEGILPNENQCRFDAPTRGAKIDDEVLEFILKYINKYG